MVVPEYQVTTIGMTVKFNCRSLGHVKWLFNNGDLPDNIEINETKKFIIIHNVTMQNEGYYKCFIVNHQDSLVSKGKLQVLG